MTDHANGMRFLEQLKVHREAKAANGGFGKLNGPLLFMSRMAIQTITAEEMKN